MTLKNLATHLQPLVASDKILENLHFSKIAQTWIWIFDNKGINDEEVHYEIIKRGASLSIELHFEVEVPISRILSQSLILPAKIKWQRHLKKYAVAYEITYDPNDPNLIQNILNGLKDFVQIMDKFYYANIPPAGTNIDLTENTNKIMNFPLNQILYGPPGTGKTYSTKELAVKIANPKFLIDITLSAAEQRVQVTNEYQKLYEAGQIVFTTFHQSMSYEDFVEGIKPVFDEDDDSTDTDENRNDIKYRIEPGIFKLACINASYYCYSFAKSSIISSAKYNFDELHQAFINHIKKLIDSGAPPVYKTLIGKDITVLKITKTDSIKARALNSIAKRNPAPLTKENIQKLYDKFESIDEIKNLSQVAETVEITPRLTEFYAVFKALKEFENTEFKEQIPEIDIDIHQFNTVEVNDRAKKFDGGVYYEATRKSTGEEKKMVLIIDEINRGNISAIFGELITLLEMDKRIGASEEIKLKLPYSKSDFGVPSNLYIIGTMNTADRSVEALDTALRRRFSFVEVMPDYGLLEDDNFQSFGLKEVLETINNRIEALLDRDHTIGHSYFLKVNDTASLVHAFKNCIIPLLQEYFYGDYEKINLVLGDGFIIKDTKNAVVFAGKNNPGYATVNKYNFTNLDESNIQAAVKLLLNFEEPKQKDDAAPAQ